MKYLITRFFLSLFMLLSLGFTLDAQNIDFTKESSLGKLYIRLYGELHYYQPIDQSAYSNGQFDAKRVVTLFGYQFNRKTQFVTEIELEHANEIFLEQAFIKHKIASNTAIKAGMILIPMGIVNENHEPNKFHSVDRPLVDRILVPTTWRDIGIGLTGLLSSFDLKYQLYAVNGLVGYKDGKAKFNSIQNFRSGRQKGVKTILSGLPALSLQLEYFGFENGKVGVSYYAGESNTDERDGLDRNDPFLKSISDSTTVFTNMVGLHANINIQKWKLMGQMIYANNKGINAYNVKTGTDLGESSLGFYAEAGRSFTKNEKWILFGRYAYIDTVLEKNDQIPEDKGLNHVVTFGLNYLAAPGAVFKLDGQVSELHTDSKFQINAGIGVWF